MTAFVARQIEAVLGADRHQPLEKPFAGSEDFSEVLARVRGTFVFYSGVPAGTDLPDTTFNHSATAWFDDCVLADATAGYCQIAVALLDDLARGSPVS